ncbi:type IV pilus twitching motility protein PilT [Burkholderia sp. LMG 13014]|uniref:type IV pilus twitching motility protein PilT n=1 Tax=Burkholderia sp. LMG 13014 TaxID=2709306 RepID=UPI00196500A6|nr:ATPase, T2SS/T4P/T4SS family [Burkholderia sp. LMG 13014]
MLLDDLAGPAIDRKDSDIHLLPGSRPAVRNHLGDIGFLETVPATSEATIKGIINAYVQDPDDWKRIERHRRYDTTITSCSRRIRLHAFRQHNGWSIAFRLLRESILPLGEIDGPRILREILQHRSGLVLITGPGGSGKSTTLTAQIDEINRTQARNIVTAEEPIEMLHTPARSTISQRSIPGDVLSLEDAVFDALRGDCNVFVAGELRDAQSIRAALTAADTGLLVLATAHGRNAAGSVQRIIDAFPAETKDLARSMLSDSLLLVAAQALVKAADGSQRMAVFETLVSNPAVRNLIRSGRTEQLESAMLSGAQHGMRTFKQSIDDLIQRRVITEHDGTHVLRGRAHDL